MAVSSFHTSTNQPAAEKSHHYDIIHDPPVGIGGEYNDITLGSQLRKMPDQRYCGPRLSSQVT